MEINKSHLSKAGAKKLDPIDKYISFFIDYKGGKPKRIVVSGKDIDYLVDNMIKNLAKKLSVNEARKLNSSKIKAEGLSYRGIPLVIE